MCLSLTSVEAGAYLPRVSAPPAPAKLWHIAQLTRKISPPRAESPSPVEYCSAGDGRAGGQRRDVGGELGDLLLAELDRLLLSLRAGVGERHPAGADLEVDRGGADADQRRGPWSVAALGVEAVAGGAVGQEQLLALRRPVAARPSAPPPCAGRARRRAAPVASEAERDQQRQGERVAPAGGECGHVRSSSRAVFEPGWVRLPAAAACSGRSLTAAGRSWRTGRSRRRRRSASSTT